MSLSKLSVVGKWSAEKSKLLDIVNRTSSNTAQQLFTTAAHLAKSRRINSKGTNMQGAVGQLMEVKKFEKDGKDASCSVEFAYLGSIDKSASFLLPEQIYPYEATFRWESIVDGKDPIIPTADNALGQLYQALDALAVIKGVAAQKAQACVANFVRAFEAYANGTEDVGDLKQLYLNNCAVAKRLDVEKIPKFRSLAWYQDPKNYEKADLKRKEQYPKYAAPVPPVQCEKYWEDIVADVKNGGALAQDLLCIFATIVEETQRSKTYKASEGTVISVWVKMSMFPGGSPNKGAIYKLSSVVPQAQIIAYKSNPRDMRFFVEYRYSSEVLFVEVVPPRPAVSIIQTIQEQPTIFPVGPFSNWTQSQVRMVKANYDAAVVDIALHKSPYILCNIRPQQAAGLIPPDASAHPFQRAVFEKGNRQDGKFIPQAKILLDVFFVRHEDVQDFERYVDTEEQFYAVLPRLVRAELRLSTDDIQRYGFSIKPENVAIWLARSVAFVSSCTLFITGKVDMTPISAKKFDGSSYHLEAALESDPAVASRSVATIDKMFEKNIVEEEERVYSFKTIEEKVTFVKDVMDMAPYDTAFSIVGARSIIDPFQTYFSMGFAMSYSALVNLKKIPTLKHLTRPIADDPAVNEACRPEGILSLSFIKEDDKIWAHLAQNSNDYIVFAVSVDGKVNEAYSTLRSQYPRVIAQLVDVVLDPAWYSADTKAKKAIRPAIFEKIQAIIASDGQEISTEDAEAILERLDETKTTLSGILSAQGVNDRPLFFACLTPASMDKANQAEIDEYRRKFVAKLKPARYHPIVAELDLSPFLDQAAAKSGKPNGDAAATNGHHHHHHDNPEPVKPVPVPIKAASDAGLEDVFDEDDGEAAPSLAADKKRQAQAKRPRVDSDDEEDKMNADDDLFDQEEDDPLEKKPAAKKPKRE